MRATLQFGLRGLHRRQRGAAAVEFAIVSLVAIPMLIAVLEFARIAYAVNAASAATGDGARAAAMCGVGSGAVLRNMQVYLPGLQAGDIDVASNGCGAGEFCTVSVQIRPTYQLNTMIPYMSSTFGIPAFTKRTIQRERYGADVYGGGSDPICD